MPTHDQLVNKAVKNSDEKACAEAQLLLDNIGFNREKHKSIFEWITKNLSYEEGSDFLASHKKLSVVEVLKAMAVLKFLPTDDCAARVIQLLESAKKENISFVINQLCNLPGEKDKPFSLNHDFDLILHIASLNDPLGFVTPYFLLQCAGFDSNVNLDIYRNIPKINEKEINDTIKNLQEFTRSPDGKYLELYASFFIDNFCNEIRDQVRLFVGSNYCGKLYSGSVYSHENTGFDFDSLSNDKRAQISFIKNIISITSTLKKAGAYNHIIQTRGMHPNLYTDGSLLYRDMYPLNDWGTSEKKKKSWRWYNLYINTKNIVSFISRLVRLKLEFPRLINLLDRRLLELNLSSEIQDFLDLVKIGLDPNCDDFFYNAILCDDHAFRVLNVKDIISALISLGYQAVPKNLEIYQLIFKSPNSKALIKKLEVLQITPESFLKYKNLIPKNCTINEALDLIIDLKKLGLENHDVVEKIFRKSNFKEIVGLLTTIYKVRDGKEFTDDFIDAICSHPNVNGICNFINMVISERDGNIAFFSRISGSVDFMHHIEVYIKLYNAGFDIAHHDEIYERIACITDVQNIDKLTSRLLSFANDPASKNIIFYADFFAPRNHNVSKMVEDYLLDLNLSSIRSAANWIVSNDNTTMPNEDNRKFLVLINNVVRMALKLEKAGCFDAVIIQNNMYPTLYSSFDQYIDNYKSTYQDCQRRARMWRALFKDAAHGFKIINKLQSYSFSVEMLIVLIDAALQADIFGENDFALSPFINFGQSGADPVNHRFILEGLIASPNASAAMKRAEIFLNPRYVSKDFDLLKAIFLLDIYPDAISDLLALTLPDAELLNLMKEISRISFQRDQVWVSRILYLLQEIGIKPSEIYTRLQADVKHYTDFITVLDGLLKIHVKSDLFNKADMAKKLMPLDGNPHSKNIVNILVAISKNLSDKLSNDLFDRINSYPNSTVLASFICHPSVVNKANFELICKILDPKNIDYLDWLDKILTKNFIRHIDLCEVLRAGLSDSKLQKESVLKFEESTYGGDSSKRKTYLTILLESTNPSQIVDKYINFCQPHFFNQGRSAASSDIDMLKEKYAGDNETSLEALLKEIKTQSGLGVTAFEGVCSSLKKKGLLTIHNVLMLVGLSFESIDFVSDKLCHNYMLESLNNDEVQSLLGGVVAFLTKIDSAYTPSDLQKLRREVMRCLLTNSGYAEQLKFYSICVLYNNVGEFASIFNDDTLAHKRVECILLAILKFEYTKNGGGSVDNVFKDCKTFDDGVKALQKNVEIYAGSFSLARVGKFFSNPSGVTNSASFKTLAAFGGIDAINKTLLQISNTDKTEPKKSSVS